MTVNKAKRTASLPNPKSGNTAYLWPFIAINLAIFFWLMMGGGFDVSWERVTAKNGVIAAAIPILAIVLSNILSDQAKARLVFWRWHHPLPGCRAFNGLIITDPRIDVAALKQKLGRFPREPRSQNALWYSLYRNHRADEKVVAAHRAYLLTRDLACIAVALFVFLPAAWVFHSHSSIAGLKYAGILSLQYILLASAGRNYGKRFVLSVLAEESHLS